MKSDAGYTSALVRALHANPLDSSLVAENRLMRRSPHARRVNAAWLLVFGLLGAMSFPGRAEAGFSCESWNSYSWGRVGGGSWSPWEFTGTDTSCRYAPEAGDGSSWGGVGGDVGDGGSDGSNDKFVKNQPVLAAKKDLCAGNPIVFSTGNKIENETDFRTGGEAGLGLEREYNKFWDGVGLFGKQWISNYDYKLTFGTSTVDSCYPRPGGGSCGIGTNTIIYAHRPGANAIKFIKQVDGTFLEEKAGAVAKIVPQGNGTFILYSEDRDVETYTSTGYVSNIKDESGIGWTYTYSGTYPTRVTHTSGRYVDFVWTNGQLTTVRDPAGNAYTYTYYVNKFGTGLHLLSTATLPGASPTTVTYHYEDASFPEALTGKSYNGVRYSWFTYDVNGRAITTEHGSGNDKYTFAYAGSSNVTSATVTNPLGKQTVYDFQNGKLVTTSGQPSTYCPLTGKGKSYDTNGYLSAETDNNGNSTTYVYNAKGQLTSKVEAFGKPEARTTTYTWDNTANRILSFAVTGATTSVKLKNVSYTYNADNRIASMTETNTSANGTANQTHLTTITYTKQANGMLATMVVDGPLPGMGDAITYTYATTTGDLLTVKNSLNHTVTYSSYNALGLPGRVTGPNGAITDVTTDARGRTALVRHIVGGINNDTVSSYGADGLLANATEPDGLQTVYTYNSARRLTNTHRDANGMVAGAASSEEQTYAYNLNGDVLRTDDWAAVGITSANLSACNQPVRPLASVRNQTTFKSGLWIRPLSTPPLPTTTNSGGCVPSAVTTARMWPTPTMPMATSRPSPIRWASPLR